MKIYSNITIATFLLLSLSACGGPSGPQEAPKTLACTVITNSCNVFDAMNTNHTGKKYFDKVHFSKDSTPQPTPSCDASGLCRLSVISGQVGGELEDSLRYLDINKGELLSISDKEAFTSDTRWTIGFRDWNIFTNGGIFPGKIGVAVVTAPSTTPGQLAGADKLFNDFDLKKAKEIPDNQFFEENIITKNPDTGRCEQYPHFMGARTTVPFPRTPSVINLVNTTRKPITTPKGDLYDGEFFLYNGNTHEPVAPPDQFLVLKDCSKPGWFAKIKVETSTEKDGKITYIRYNITYKSYK